MNLAQQIVLMAGDGQMDMTTIIMMGGVFIVFYFFMIRPQQKKAKEAKTFRESLGKGDKVITVGGIHGKVTELKDTNLVIETEDGSRLRVERSAVSPELTTGTGESALTQAKK